MSGNISILIDEFTSLGNKLMLIIYLKCEIDKEISHFLLLDLTELPDQKSDTVLNAIKVLNKHRFDNNYIKTHFYWIC